MAEQYKIIHPVKYYRDYLNNDIRPDGREFDKLRPTAINVGSIGTADGSAIVKIGNTNVVCGIRAELAKPKAVNPENGYLVPNVELTAMCSPKYRSGSSTHDADVFSCALNDILINSEVIDLKELCIHKEKLVWCIYLDVVCFDLDGSFIDAAIIAIVAALHNLKLPKAYFDPTIEKITVDTDIQSSINVRSLPVSTTFMVFDDNVILVDPTAEEENLSSAILTIAACKSEVCFILKPGGTALNEDQMSGCIKQALAREKSVVKLLNEVLKT